MAEVLTETRQPTPRRRPELAEPTVEVAGLFPMQGEWREHHYFDLPESNWFVELSDGRLVMPDMPGTTHQRVVLRLLRLLDDFVAQHVLGEVAVAPLPVRLRPGKVREPDIMFMHRDHVERIEERRWGVPDLVVEVISPRTPESSGTEATDREEKHREYAQAGVQEYWLVHPTARTIEVYTLSGEAYELLGRWGGGETARSRLLEGFEAAVDEVMPR
jgi:Uma2 family endonuclease